MQALIERLEKYSPTNEWGDKVHHTICDEAAMALRDLTELVAGFVQDEDDARSNPGGGVSLGGLMDCRDNAGCVYQSAGLAARITKARALTLPSAPAKAA